MTPNSPAPDPDVLEAAKDRLVAAQEKREKDHAAVDREFWTAVAAEISSGNLRQVDAATALGFTREYIRRNLKQLAETD
ncbi:hypothetical protein [Streptomyces sp. CA-111067]|uniref:hypothetical protein n=1 Tax=Streptomyces sp. CA-111067 TaxID=3240046 RepID=UPI003D98D0E8